MLHLVFIPKCRRKVFNSEDLCLFSAMLADVGADFGAVLTDRNGEDNRVHLLIEFPRQCTSQSW